MLLELKEYSQEVDVDFVRRAIRTTGRCHVKLENAAQRCVNVLLELIKARVPYVVQAAVVVVANIFERINCTVHNRGFMRKSRVVRRTRSQRGDDLDRRGICGFDRERRRITQWFPGRFPRVQRHAVRLPDYSRVREALPQVAATRRSAADGPKCVIHVHGVRTIRTYGIGDISTGGYSQ